MQEYHQVHESWRNHQRIAFIKGFYKARYELLDLCNNFQSQHEVKHVVIDAVLEDHLRELKDLSHTLFRVEEPEERDMEQRLFDKVLGEVWHELGKARDNIRLIEVYTEQDNNLKDRFIRSVSWLEKQVIASARRDLPGQMKRSRQMMEKLVSIFERILPVYRDNEVIYRTIYFSRTSLDPYCDPEAISYFFRIMFNSVQVGYLELIRSLIRTKHITDAQDAVKKLRAWVKENQRGITALKQAESELNTAITTKQN
jgi:hypothetical protein